MKIGGFETLSLCDYPGTPAAVVFTQGCNWRCPFCHNRSLLSLTPEEGKYESIAILNILRERRNVLDGVVLTGGEPTLQKDLFSFMVELKAMDYKVKLDTNGTQPVIIDSLLAHSVVDYIAMDIKAPWDKYGALTGDSKVDLNAVRESVEIISRGRAAHHFRTTYPPELLEEHDLEAIRNALPAGSPHIIQEYRDPY